MTVKGQVTVPKELRDAYGWRPGDQVAFMPDQDGVRIVRPRRRRKGQAVLERLRRATWDRRLSTDGLMALTRGRRS
jgi:AbrB family looped-hinge helix DNA binding protein